MTGKPKYYLTTPIYYVNARPHMGHAYSTIVADTIARYKRMRGYDVVLTTGTDEHGQKIERAAKAAGVQPEKLADRVSAEYRQLWQELGLQIDRFVRTTEPRHERAVRRLLLKARDNGYIYKGSYEGQYCVFDELYVDDPTPNAPCPECGRPTERVTEENYFFKLSAFQDRLLKLYEDGFGFVQPETRRNEVKAFVQSGLRDLSVSRTSVKWGIPWPDDDKHVFYVWYEALISYMTAVGYGDDELQWERYWPADLHLIGKEILRFHAVYWPAFLMAADEPLPKRVFAHGWWLFEQEKMSKSRGNMQYPQPVARVLGVDALRYFLLREMVFGQDGNFSRESLITRYNSDLANGLGNLASRTLTMIERYFGGEVPEPGSKESQAGSDVEVKLHGTTAISNAIDSYDELDFSSALQAVWHLIAETDKYLSAEKPWTLAEDAEKRARLGAVLYTAAEALRIVTVLAYPAIPQSAEKIWAQLGQWSKLGEQQLDQLQWGQLKPGTRVGKTKSLFPRVEKKEAWERIEAMEEEIKHPSAPAAAGTPAAPAAAASAPAPQGPVKIGIEDFTKIEMRVGQIKSAEKVAGADKLLKILVDIGEEVRQVVAGIAEVYKPEEIVGRKVVVVVNLAPRKLRGVESNGMIVAASVGPEGKPVLAGFLEDVPVGSRLK
jgi:methionyl-tRNA synthetase